MIDTRLTRMFGLTHPIALAPMDKAAGGRLAAAVAAAGGLGIIGGGYCDADWIEQQFKETGDEAVGCGFITWRLAETPNLLSRVLEKRPRAIFLSFGDPTPFSKEIKGAGVPLICQVQTLEGAKQAVKAEADIIVAQGREAGGHGGDRSTLTLIPEIADYLYHKTHDTLLLAAGGIVDARGLAACIAMGADGVVMGTRLWASEEALVHPKQIEAAIKAGGDNTIRTKIIDKVRGMAWPEPYDIRVLQNEFTDRWHNKPDDFERHLPSLAKEWAAAWESGDASTANAIAGEGIGIIYNAPSVREILQTITFRAENILNNINRKVIG